ncbi:variable surface protein [Plasmodium gonderi]|uniref:Variable surface protein n=1 Tax=Plasmodium gonderi TaxID=77519 RepID=A0A1Y1JNA8_PLAGO|nr:variable surface protein [Plasmodium gonderi]GAW84076.1 variable surface protein [Plasmodium gonderi]
MNMENENLHLDHIFPQCRDDYKRAQIIYPNGSRINTDLGYACEDFNKEIAVLPWSHYQVDCVSIGRYLHFIKNISKNKKSHCKYFNYILMHKILSKGTKCYNAINCYNKMINIQNRGYDRIPNVCKDYVEQLDGKEFRIFHDLDQLYMNFEKVKLYSTKCRVAGFCYNTYKSLLERSRHINIDGFDNALKEFKYKYEEYMKNVYSCGNELKLLYSFPERDVSITTKTDKSSTTEKIPRTQEEQFKETMLDTSSVAEAITEIDSEIKSGILVLVFAILIVVFILCKYTPYFSCLKPRLGILNKRLNREHTERHNLIDSFKKELNPLKKSNKHQIAYKLEHYW